MGRRNAISLCALAIVVILAFASSPAAQAQTVTSSQVRSQVAAAFASIQGAEASGGNVTKLVGQLNSAIALVEQADLVNSTDPTRAQILLAQASALALQVASEAPPVAAAGRASIATAQLVLGVETVSLGILAVVAYVFMPRLFWRFWLRAHRGWRLKKR